MGADSLVCKIGGVTEAAFIDYGISPHYCMGIEIPTNVVTNEDPEIVEENSSDASEEVSEGNEEEVTETVTLSSTDAVILEYLPKIYIENLLLIALLIFGFTYTVIKRDILHFD